MELVRDDPKTHRLSIYYSLIWNVSIFSLMFIKVIIYFYSRKLGN
jgi:hypothetical protein